MSVKASKSQRGLESEPFLLPSHPILATSREYDFRTRRLETMILQEVRDDTERACSVLVEVKVMASIRLEVRREVGILVICLRRLLEDTRAITIADNVVFFSRDGL